MNADEARKLATKVAKESSNVTVKLGRTNGRAVLHLKHRGASSVTIAEPWQWSEHAWNNNNRPTRREEAEALMADAREALLESDSIPSRIIKAFGHA